jgi:NAD(P)-dependent dehydrogenase (short-subunit alcohol dehydrogenase family)
MSDKLLVLITGANQGLGYYAAQQLAATGNHHVLLGSRDIIKAETAVHNLVKEQGTDPTNISPIQIDVDSDLSIAAAAGNVEKTYGYLDILMLNAGILGAEGSTREQYARVYNTNVFGSVVTVDAFLPLLRKSTTPNGKRIAFTSSNFGSLQMTMEVEMLNPKAAPQVNVYRSSKTATNMVMGIYTKMLEDEGFVVSASDPGFCATNMNGYSGWKDPKDGARVLVRAVIGDKEDVHGRLINENGPEAW